MSILPCLKNRRLSIFFISLFAFLLSVSPALAASAYISPATGLITNSSFKVSVYVESSTTEPQIAGADIKINYPANVTVVSINNGDFDSYVEKTFDATTRQIKINALNNAGNYKSGKVKLASINFDTTATTGQVQLTIDPTSGISGADGTQLLTETINGVYTLDIAGDTTTTPPADDTGTTPEGKGAPVPETGGNSILVYGLIAAGLLGAGVLTIINPLKRR